MPQLIKNIQGNLVDDYIGNVVYMKSIVGEVQEEDYININGFIAYLQNQTQIEFTSGLKQPLNLGLNNKNLPIVTLNINY